MEMNPFILCIHLLTRIWCSLGVILSDNELGNLNKFLTTFSNNSAEYHLLLKYCYQMYQSNVLEYPELNQYFQKSSIRREVYDNSLKSRYFLEFKNIINNIIIYFPSNNSCNLFDSRQFILNECSESFYQMFKFLNNKSDPQAMAFLEKSSNMNNFKAHFEIGLNEFEQKNYKEAYQYFMKCSENPNLNQPLEIYYPPSLNMVGIMYYYGLFVKTDNDFAKELFRMSVEINQDSEDGNFERSQKYKLI